jgi:ubiquinone/menaquinone biosynthesis C-methylase UbiE
MRTRSTELELLDVETPPLEMMARVAGYLAFVNRWLGGTRAVAFHLRKLAEPATILDVAAGAADLPLDLARRFPNLRPVAFDLSGTMLSLARGLPRVRGDVRRLPFRDRSVDFVISTHYFHHLTDDQIVRTLVEFDRIARRGIIVNDLLRRRRALFWVRLFTLFANRYVKTDGPRSVRRGFTVAEIEALARRAGLGWLRVRVHFGHRFTLAGERPR